MNAKQARSSTSTFVPPEFVDMETLLDDRRVESELLSDSCIGIAKTIHGDFYSCRTGKISDHEQSLKRIQQVWLNEHHEEGQPNPLTVVHKLNPRYASHVPDELHAKSTFVVYQNVLRYVCQAGITKLNGKVKSRKLYEGKVHPSYDSIQASCPNRWPSSDGKNTLKAWGKQARLIVASLHTLDSQHQHNTARATEWLRNQPDGQLFYSIGYHPAFHLPETEALHNLSALQARQLQGNIPQWLRHFCVAVPEDMASFETLSLEKLHEHARKLADPTEYSGCNMWPWCASLHGRAGSAALQKCRNGAQEPELCGQCPVSLNFDSACNIYLNRKPKSGTTLPGLLNSIRIMLFAAGLPLPATQSNQPVETAAPESSICEDIGARNIAEVHSNGRPTAHQSHSSSDSEFEAIADEDTSSLELSSDSENDQPSDLHNAAKNLRKWVGRGLQKEPSVFLFLRDDFMFDGRSGTLYDFMVDVFLPCAAQSLHATPESKDACKRAAIANALSYLPQRSQEQIKLYLQDLVERVELEGQHKETTLRNYAYAFYVAASAAFHYVSASYQDCKATLEHLQRIFTVAGSVQERDLHLVLRRGKKAIDIATEALGSQVGHLWHGQTPIWSITMKHLTTLSNVCMKAIFEVSQQIDGRERKEDWKSQIEAVHQCFNDAIADISAEFSRCSSAVNRAASQLVTRRDQSRGRMAYAGSRGEKIRLGRLYDWEEGFEACLDMVQHTMAPVQEAFEKWRSESTAHIRSLTMQGFASEQLQGKAVQLDVKFGKDDLARCRWWLGAALLFTGIPLRRQNYKDMCLAHVLTGTEIQLLSDKTGSICISKRLKLRCPGGSKHLDPHAWYMVYAQGDYKTDRHHNVRIQGVHEKLGYYFLLLRWMHVFRGQLCSTHDSNYVSAVPLKALKKVMGTRIWSKADGSVMTGNMMYVAVRCIGALLTGQPRVGWHIVRSAFISRAFDVFSENPAEVVARFGHVMQVTYPTICVHYASLDPNKITMQALLDMQAMLPTQLQKVVYNKARQRHDRDNQTEVRMLKAFRTTYRDRKKQKNARLLQLEEDFKSTLGEACIPSSIQLARPVQLDRTFASVWAEIDMKRNDDSDPSTDQLQPGDTGNEQHASQQLGAGARGKAVSFKQTAEWTLHEVQALTAAATKHACGNVLVSQMLSAFHTYLTSQISCANLLESCPHTFPLFLLGLVHCSSTSRAQIAMLSSRVAAAGIVVDSGVFCHRTGKAIHGKLYKLSNWIYQQPQVTVQALNCHSPAEEVLNCQLRQSTCDTHALDAASPFFRRGCLLLLSSFEDGNNVVTASPVGVPVSYLELWAWISQLGGLHAKQQEKHKKHKIERTIAATQFVALCILNAVGTTLASIFRRQSAVHSTLSKAHIAELLVAADQVEKLSTSRTNGQSTSWAAQNFLKLWLPVTDVRNISALFKVFTTNSSKKRRDWLEYISLRTKDALERDSSKILSTNFEGRAACDLHILRLQASEYCLPALECVYLVLICAVKELSSSARLMLSQAHQHKSETQREAWQGLCSVVPLLHSCIQVLSLVPSCRKPNKLSDSPSLPLSPRLSPTPKEMACPITPDTEQATVTTPSAIRSLQSTLTADSLCEDEMKLLEMYRLQSAAKKKEVMSRLESSYPASPPILKHKRKWFEGMRMQPLFGKHATKRLKSHEASYYERAAASPMLEHLNTALLVSSGETPTHSIRSAEQISDFESPKRARFLNTPVLLPRPLQQQFVTLIEDAGINMNEDSCRTNISESKKTAASVLPLMADAEPAKSTSKLLIEHQTKRSKHVPEALEAIDVPGDGHCLIYSVATSLTSFRATSIITTSSGSASPGMAAQAFRHKLADLVQSKLGMFACFAVFMAVDSPSTSCGKQLSAPFNEIERKVFAKFLFLLYTNSANLQEMDSKSAAFCPQLLAVLEEAANSVDASGSVNIQCRWKEAVGSARIYVQEIYSSRTFLGLQFKVAMFIVFGVWTFTWDCHVDPDSFPVAAHSVKHAIVPHLTARYKCPAAARVLYCPDQHHFQGLLRPEERSHHNGLAEAMDCLQSLPQQQNWGRCVRSGVLSTDNTMLQLVNDLTSAERNAVYKVASC